MNKKGIINLGAALVAVFGTLSLPTAVAASSGDTVVIAGQQDGWGFSGDGGPATQASLHDPVGVVSDQSGNYYIADSLNNRIRKIDSTGTINTLSSDVSGLRAIAISSDGTLYVATTSQVFRVESLGERTNLITDESISTSSWDIHGIAVDQVGNVYVASRSEGRVYLIDVTGSVSILVRKSDPLLEDDETVVDGLSSVADVAIDSNSNLFFADQDSHRVFKRNSSGLVTVFAGTGDPDVSGDRGLAVDADVYRPSSLAVDGAGNVFIDNGAIRKVDSAGRICSIYSPYGSYTSQKSLSVDVSGDLVFPSGNRILKLKSPTCLGSAWDEIKNDPQVGLFRQLVEAGGRAESLDACPGSLTVLAPVNSGLEEIADQLGISFEALKGNPALVTGIINDHVSRWRLEFRRVEQGLSYWIGDSDLHWNFTQQPSGAEGTRKVGENIYVNGKFITFGKGTCAGSIFKIDSPISWPPSGNTTFVEWLGPTTPTNSRNLLFELRFSHPVTGLTVTNFENSGSQQNCTMSVTKGEALSEFSSNYFLTGLCQGSGTFAPRLKFLPVTAQTGTRFFANPVGPVIDMVQGKVLEIRKTGDGAGSVESTISAIECGPLCFGVFNTGTQVTLRPTAEPGSIFAGWSGACRGFRTCTVRMATAQTLTAEFQRARALVISRVGSGSGSVTARSAGVNCPPSAPSPCTSWHLRGQSITLQATPARGSRFVGWMGACTGSRTCTIPAVKGTVSPTTHVFAVFNRGR